MDRAQYRLVHFAPDPSSQTRFPLGALVREGRVTRVVMAPHSPGAECLGGTQRARTFSRLQQRLMRHGSFDALGGFGPYCALSEVFDLPEEAPTDFVDKLVGSWRQPSATGSARGISRKQQGVQWFKHWQVDALVQHDFRPGAGFGGFLKHAPALERVSHFVPGAHSLLLMEPIVLRPQVRDDIGRLASRFGSYRTAIEGHEGPDTHLIAYTLGVTPDIRAAAERALAYCRTRVVDTDDVAQRSDFLRLMRGVAEENALANGYLHSSK